MSDWSIIVITLIIIVGSFLALSRIIDLSSPPRRKQKSMEAGTIVINTTDPKKDVIRIELGVSVGELMDMKNAKFRIEIEDS